MASIADMDWPVKRRLARLTSFTEERPLLRHALAAAVVTEALGATAMPASAQQVDCVHRGRISILSVWRQPNQEGAAS